VKPLLLDVNVLLALGSDKHQFHAVATAWFDKRAGRRWATCPLTECGFIRLSSHPRLQASGGSPAQAIEVIRGIRAVRGHEFWPDDYSPADEPLFDRLSGHQQVTDAYLLALAVRRDGQLATFDRALKTLARTSLGDADRVLLIPAEAA